MFAYRTQTIQNNAFYPQWQWKFDSFEVPDSEMSTITFMLYDEDNDADDFMAYYSMPVIGLRSGYRTVPLLGSLHAPLDYACLFVKVWSLLCSQTPALSLCTICFKHRLDTAPAPLADSS